MSKTIDFNDLSRGTVVDNEYSSQGVTISGITAQGASGRAMIFDSARPTGGDHDLESDTLGNVLIISEDGDSHDPDDNARGGVLRFDFTNGADVDTLTFFDVEESATVSFYDANGAFISEKTVVTADNGQITADLHVAGVYRMEVQLHGSGAVDNLTFSDIATLDGTVEGTSGNDLIDLAYTGDPDGDRVDGEDAIIDDAHPNDDLIYGFEGNDTIISKAGNDEIYGGIGDDSVDGGVGDDLIFGGAGNDTLKGGGGADTVFGGAGGDRIIGAAENDQLSGDSGDDIVLGGAGDDDIRGDSGDDTLKGQDGDDAIFGGAGNDAIDTGAGSDVAFGGADADTFKADSSDIIYGGSGGDDNDTLDVRGEGLYFLTGPTGTGSPTPDGNGNGFDGCLVFVDADGNTTGHVIEFREIETILGDGEVSRDPNATDNVYTVDALEAAGDVDGNVITDDTGAGADSDPDNDDLTIIAVDGDTAKVGQPVAGSHGGLFTINADGTVDFNANGDFDTLGAGDSTDTSVTYTITGDDGGTDTAEVTFTVTGKSDGTVQGSEGDDVITPDVPYVDADGDAVDSLDGVLPGDEGTNNDLIDAMGGNDTVNAGLGDDRVFGGAGNDDVSGGQGDDTLLGEAGDDTLSGGDDQDTLFGGAGRDTLAGGQDDDVLVGGADDDTLFGGDGNDVAEGGAGEDRFVGGAGSDALFGGLNSDVFTGGTAGDVVVGGEDPDGKDVDVLDLSSSDVDRIEYENDDPEAGTVFFNDGTTMTFSEIENVIPCFTPGTLIATPRGERLVQDLKVGDRVITRDNGIQEIAWLGHKPISGRQLIQNPHLQPVLIKRGALGQGLPERDMMVSPNHRMLVSGDKTQLYFEENEVLAAAKHMVGAKGIHTVDVMQTTYIHFMFERHEVVLSNGAWTESFQPGDHSLKGIGNGQRAEIFDLFPELATHEGREDYQAARKSLKKHEAKLLLD